MVNWVSDLGLRVVLYSYLCDTQVSFFSFPLRPFVPMLMDYTYPKLPFIRAISLSYWLIVLQATQVRASQRCSTSRPCWPISYGRPSSWCPCRWIQFGCQYSCRRGCSSISNTSRVFKLLVSLNGGIGPL
jgi:hypothetical protein